MLWKNIELHLYANANKCGKSYQQWPERFWKRWRVLLGKTLGTCHLSQKCYGGNQITQNVWIIFQSWDTSD